MALVRMVALQLTASAALGMRRDTPAGGPKEVLTQKPVVMPEPEVKVVGELFTVRGSVVDERGVKWKEWALVEAVRVVWPKVGTRLCEANAAEEVGGPQLADGGGGGALQGQ